MMEAGASIGLVGGLIFFRGGGYKKPCVDSHATLIVSS